MWFLVTNSYYFKIVFTVIILVLQTRGMFVFNTVLLYHYTIGYTWYMQDVQRLALDIGISTCLVVKLFYICIT